MSSMNTTTNTSPDFTNTSFTDTNPSSYPSSTNTDYTSNIDSTTLATQPPPTHHLHQSSEVLPGARDTAGSDRPLDVRPTPQGTFPSTPRSHCKTGSRC